MDKDQQLIWEAYFPPGRAIGSHEKGVAIELIKMYEGAMLDSVNISKDQFEGLMMDKWKEIIADDNTDEDQVLNHIMDQEGALQPGTAPGLFAMYRNAKGEMPR